MFNKILFGIIILLSAIHLFTSFISLQDKSRILMENDSSGYLSYAAIISNSPDYRFWEQDLGVIRTPGYPLFISIVFQITEGGVGNVIIAQSLLLIITACVLFLMIRNYTNTTAALAGAILLLIDPISFIYSKSVLTETLYTLFFCLSVWALIKYIASRKNYWLLVISAFLLISTFTRPVGIAMAAYFIIAIFIYELNFQRNIVIAVTKSIFVLFILYIGIFSWTLRNEKFSGCHTFSAIGKINLRDWMAARALSIGENISIDDARSQVENGIGICEIDSGDSIKIILDYFPEYLEVHFNGIASMFLGFDFEKWVRWVGEDYVMPDFWQPLMSNGLLGLISVFITAVKEFPLMGLSSIFLEGYQLILYFLVLMGTLWAIKIERVELRIFIWFLIGLLFLMINLPGPVGDPRFRVPINPIFIFIICVGISEKLKNKNLINISIDPNHSVG